MDAHRLARLRAIFAKLNKSKGLRPVRKVALYGGIAAGAYYGGRAIKQKIQERRDEKHRARLRSVVMSLKGQPDPHQIEEVKNKYTELFKDLSPVGRRRVVESIKLGKRIEQNDKRKKSLKTLIRELRQESSMLSAYELGHTEGRETTEAEAERRIKALTKGSEAYQEAQRRFHAKGIDVPGISGPEESERLAEAASALLGEDAETKLDKARRWKEKKEEAYRSGRISRQQYMKAVDKFVNYRERLLKKQKLARKNRGLLKDISRPSYKKLRDYYQYNEDE